MNFTDQRQHFYIITPCSRPENLPILEKSLDFSKLCKWIIVHDSKKSHRALFEGREQIEEYFNSHKSHGIPQRNMGIAKVPLDGLVYFLDDDNIIQPYFWETPFALDKITTFDCLYNNTTLCGNALGRNHIDTCMFVVPRKWCVPWYSVRPDESASDGTFLENIVRLAKSDTDGWHVYIHKKLMAYNALRSFTHERYAQKYNDVFDAFGYDKDKLWHHFVTTGIQEKRSTF